MKHCIECGCNMPDNHESNICECCQDDRRDPCLRCDCWDPDYESCTMPSYDRSYACPQFGEVGR